MLKVSVCITTFNEERTIGELLQSLLTQTHKPDEIIIVDSHSKDQTAKIIRHYQKKYKFIKLISENSSRAKGRNIAIQHSQNDIIAITDAGCIAENDWLEKITEPFKDKNIEIVAGFYDMQVLNSSLKKTFSVFLGITPRNFDSTFMPSTRSMSLTKTAWIKAGGFPENLTDTAEDTVFNHNALRKGLRFSRVKKARVLWQIPSTLKEYALKIYLYALGDSGSGIWFNNATGTTSHNIRVTIKILMYLTGIILFSVGAINPFYGRLFFILFILYMFNAFRKVYGEYDDFMAGLWGVVVQFTTDFASIAGLLSSALPQSSERRLRKSFFKK